MACDHIVGLNRDEEMIVYQSGLDVVEYVDQPFYYCPDCGERLVNGLMACSDVETIYGPGEMCANAFHIPGWDMS